MKIIGNKSTDWDKYLKKIDAYLKKNSDGSDDDLYTRRKHGDEGPDG